MMKNLFEFMVFDGGDAFLVEDEERATEIGRELKLVSVADRRRLWQRAGKLLLEARPD